MVKTKDGSFTRKKLSDIRAGAKTSGTASPTLAPVVVAPKLVAKQAVKPPRPADSDFNSPLDEPEVKNTDGLSLASALRQNEIKQILRSLTFTINNNLAKRLENAILLYLKDVRTRDQTKNFLLKEIINGGVAITQMQAEEVLRACDKKIQQSIAEQAVMVRPLESLQTIAPKPLATIAGNLPSAQNLPSTAFTMPIINTPASITPEPKPAFSINSGSGNNRLMSDVVAPPLTQNPIDEIKYLNLVDFRRLGKTPEVATQIILNKFNNLKQESIIYYLQGLAAWQQCPLYKIYVKMAGRAVEQNSAIQSQANELTADEVKALISLNSKLE